MIKQVSNMTDRELPALPEIITKYHITHIIAALITGGVSHTSRVKSTIAAVIIIALKYKGKNLSIYAKNITKIVILNPLTAIK